LFGFRSSHPDQIESQTERRVINKCAFRRAQFHKQVDFDCELWHALDDMTKLIDLKQIVIPSKIGAKALQTARNRTIVKEA